MGIEQNLMANNAMYPITLQKKYNYHRYLNLHNYAHDLHHFSACVPHAQLSTTENNQIPFLWGIPSPPLPRLVALSKYQFGKNGIHPVYLYHSVIKAKVTIHFETSFKFVHIRFTSIQCWNVGLGRSIPIIQTWHTQGVVTDHIAIQADWSHTSWRKIIEYLSMDYYEIWCITSNIRSMGFMTYMNDWWFLCYKSIRNQIAWIIQHNFFGRYWKFYYNFLINECTNARWSADN